MKHKFYALTLVGLLAFSSIGAPTVVGAEEIVSHEQTEATTTLTLENVEYVPRDILDNVIRENKERGTVGKYGKRPNIPQVSITKKQADCLILGYGTMLSGAITFGNNFWLLSQVPGAMTALRACS
ncbi:hypothetical protein [Enterococcus faecium]|uniref:hypothetical protein n=1 Tax=Enterococcus faecium TaxID=1352 RepID=UPI000A359A2C|nr:hypothetical protein [Enterococcus faecium]OTN91548.1 hypothetical protein A5809_000913 [Enterococcus faecium]